jgi:hypothetical protein
MRTTLVGALSAALLICLSAVFANAQTAPDPALLAEIMQIKAFDNHAHPWRAVNEGEVDNEGDALIPDALEDQPLPLRLRPDNAEYIAAWRALALALTGMMQDGEITRARASALAHMVLHDNAAKLYKQ